MSCFAMDDTESRADAIALILAARECVSFLFSSTEVVEEEDRAVFIGPDWYKVGLAASASRGEETVSKCFQSSLPRERLSSHFFIFAKRLFNSIL